MAKNKGTLTLKIPVTVATQVFDAINQTSFTVEYDLTKEDIDAVLKEYKKGKK